MRPHDGQRFRVWLVALVLGSIAGPGVARGEGAGETPLARYRAQALQARFSAWSGLKVTRAGEPVELGFFGGRYREVFANSAEAREAMGTFRTLRISGTVLWAAGLAALLTDIVLVAAESDLVLDETTQGLVVEREVNTLFWGLFIGGAVVGMTGGVMMQGANGYLSDAVIHHNDALYRQLSASRQGRRVVLRYRGAF
jgi:hypothetical protein